MLREFPALALKIGVLCVGLVANRDTALLMRACPLLWLSGHPRRMLRRLLMAQSDIPSSPGRIDFRPGLIAQESYDK